MSTTDTDARLLSSLGDVRALEQFLHTLLGDLARNHPKPGEDVLPRVKKLGLEVPDALKGLELTWDRARLDDSDLGDGDPISIVRPGNPNALGLTIGCIRIGPRVKVCLECGWVYCKIVIVIKGTL